VHESNYRYIHDFEEDAALMWLGLKNAHQDSTAGGRMFWLRKLVQATMTGDDIDAHINQLANYAEKLNVLISTKSPLTADKIHLTSLLISLPSNWINCVSAMMNEEQVSSTRVVPASKAESLRRKS
jgi:hypothetical protein